jgi:hypothetical protein
MDSSIVEFEKLILCHKISRFDRYKLDIQSINLLSAIDGRTSIGEIAHKYDYSKAFIAKKLISLAKYDLIEPVNGNGKIVTTELMKHLLQTICNQYDNHANADAARQFGYTAEQPASQPADHSTVKPYLHVHANGGRPAPAANIVFSSMLAHMFSIVAKKDSQKFVELRKELKRSINRFEINKKVIAALLIWLSEPKRPIIYTIPDTILRRIITNIYSLICEHYGPDLADQALQSAAEVADTIPEAQEVSPRQYL